MRHILCPVDFSALSAQALRYAGRLADACGARLTVLYADLFMPPPYFTEAQIERLEQELREARRQGEVRLREFASAALGPEAHEFGVRAIEDLPVEGIRHAAAELHPDLIVMGTHGRSGINRWMLGSVAERVLRASSIPVLTVRCDRPPRRILVAVDDSRASGQARALAGELAGCLAADLEVLEMGEPQRESAASEILEHAAASACDLLVLGAVHRPFFDSTVLGATVARVVRHAPCPVLTVIQEAQHAV